MNAPIQRGDRVRLTRERIDGTYSRSEWVGTVESVGQWGFELAIDGSTVLHNGEALPTSARSYFAWDVGPAYTQTIDRLPLSH